LHIAAFVANWKDKSTNSTLAKTLSSGLDSLVFVDETGRARQ